MRLEFRVPSAGAEACALLALDLGQKTGWAARNTDGAIASGTVEFKPGRFEGGSMVFLRYRAWLQEVDEERRPAMNGPRLLEHAAGLVNRRRREYGEPADLFEQVAARWSLTLGTKLSPAQVVLCLVDLKLARLARDPKHLDSYCRRRRLCCRPAGSRSMKRHPVKPHKVSTAASSRRSG